MRLNIIALAVTGLVASVCAELKLNRDTYTLQDVAVGDFEERTPSLCQGKSSNFGFEWTMASRFTFPSTYDIFIYNHECMLQHQYRLADDGHFSSWAIKEDYFNSPIEVKIDRESTLPFKPLVFRYDAEEFSPRNPKCKYEQAEDPTKATADSRCRFQPVFEVDAGFGLVE